MLGRVCEETSPASRLDVRFQRLCEVPNYVKMLPARQLFQALEAIIAAHSFRTLQFLELAHQQV
jgi:hypothetical protein